MKKKGFTLIELMIVVAIIGILAAIAIPDFLRMRAKARQTEARTNLAAIAGCQISYFGEADGWGSTFDLIDWSPTSPPKYAMTMWPDLTTDLVGSPICNNTTTTCVSNCHTGAQAAGGCEAAGTAWSGGFTATAEANIDGDDTVDDCWCIGTNKVPVNALNDVKLE